MVVIAGSCLCVKFIPQIHPFCLLQCPPANSEQIENVAVSPDDFYLDVCLCHGVFLSVVGALPPPCLRSVVQVDALEVVVAFADFRVVCLDRLAERLYADIDFVSGSTVEGVLYLISEANLARLDAYEGYPKVYRRLWLEVEFDGGSYQAITYEMSRWTKFIRRRKRYPEEYRKICSFGADYYGIKNNFKK